MHLFLYNLCYVVLSLCMTLAEQNEATSALMFNMSSNWLFMLLCCLIWLSALCLALKRGNLTVTLSLTVKWHHKKNVRFRFSHFADILLNVTFKKLILVMGCQMHYGWAMWHPRSHPHGILSQNKHWKLECWIEQTSDDKKKNIHSKEKDTASTISFFKIGNREHLKCV